MIAENVGNMQGGIIDNTTDNRRISDKHRKRKILAQNMMTVMVTGRLLDTQKCE